MEGWGHCLNLRKEIEGQSIIPLTVAGHRGRFHTGLLARLSGHDADVHKGCPSPPKLHSALRGVNLWPETLERLNTPDRRRDAAPTGAGRPTPSVRAIGRGARSRSEPFARASRIRRAATALSNACCYRRCHDRASLLAPAVLATRIEQTTGARPLKFDPLPVARRSSTSPHYRLVD